MLQTVSLKPGELCQSVLPSLQVLLESLARNMTSLNDLAFETFVGDPKTYNFKSSWFGLLKFSSIEHTSDFLCLYLF